MKCPACDKEIRTEKDAKIHAWNVHTMTFSEWLAECARVKAERRNRNA